MASAKKQARVDPVKLKLHWEKYKKFYILGFSIAVIAALFPFVMYVSGFVFFSFKKINPLIVSVGTWWEVFQTYPEQRPELWKAFWGTAGAIYIVLPVVLAVAIFKDKAKSLHGDARFANTKEITKAGLFKDDETAILVGKHNGKLLRFSGFQFVILAAPTRSGKGVGIVIPNCLNYQHSLVVLDIKQENYQITSGYRKNVLGQEIYLFNPFAEDLDKDGKAAPRTHRYNILSSISQGIFRTGDILAIGNAFWKNDPSSKDAFWNDGARNLFLGIVSMLCDVRDQRALELKENKRTDLPDWPINMGEVLRQSSGKGKNLEDHLKGCIEKFTFLQRQTVDALNNFLSTPEATLGSILGTFNAPLTIWHNPIVDYATSANDFDLKDVRTKKMTVYLGITPDHLGDCALLINVIFSLLINLNTKKLPKEDPTLKYQVLLLMDEFTAIGLVNIIVKSVSYMAGYNVRLLPIIQSLAQLTDVYDKSAESIVTNHAMQIIYAPRQQKDADETSKMLGNQTVKSRSVSRPKGMMGGGGKGGSGISESESDQVRALMLPQEIKEMGLDRELIMLENCKPIFCHRIRYYSDPMFMERLMPAADIQPGDIHKYMDMLDQASREYVSVSKEDIKKNADGTESLIGPPRASAESSQLYESFIPNEDMDPSVIEDVVNVYRCSLNEEEFKNARIEKLATFLNPSTGEWDNEKIDMAREAAKGDEKVDVDNLFPSVDDDDDGGEQDIKPNKKVKRKTKSKEKELENATEE